MTEILNLLVVLVKGNARSICYKGDSTNRDHSSGDHNGACNDLPNPNCASNACLAHTTKAGGSYVLQSNQAVTGLPLM